MSQGIKEFYQEAAGRGLQRDFQLRIVSWNLLNSGAGNLASTALTDLDTVLLKTATLPQMETTINPAPFMGLEFNVPGTTKFPGSKAWNLEFYMTQQANLRNKFIETLKRNFDFENNSTGNLQLPPQFLGVQFSLVDDQLQAITRYMLHGAFITSVGEVSFDLTGSGAIQKLPVTIAYQYWTSGRSGNNLGSSDAGTGSEVGDFALGTFNAAFAGTQGT